MLKSRHTKAQIIGALKQLEAGREAQDVAREVGVSKHTIYAWKAKYGRMDVSQAQEAKQLHDVQAPIRHQLPQPRVLTSPGPTFPQTRRRLALYRGLAARSQVRIMTPAETGGRSSLAVSATERDRSGSNRKHGQRRELANVPAVPPSKRRGFSPLVKLWLARACNVSALSLRIT